MPIASTTVLNLVDAMASTLGQAMQLARTRLASVISPIMRLYPVHYFMGAGPSRDNCRNSEAGPQSVWHLSLTRS